jgi:hypothetical protein
LLVSAALWAADPFLGYWRLDPQKSALGSNLKALTGGITFEATSRGYLFHEAIVFGEDKVSRRWGTMQFGTAPRRIGGAMTYISQVDATSFEVVYSNGGTGKRFCTFRYTVYPQIETLILAVIAEDEIPVYTLVFTKR